MLVRMIAFLLSAMGILFVAGPTHANQWPTKPVRIVVPYGAGGATDVLARSVAEALTVTFKEQFYIENRPGSSGTTGSAMVAKATPDGYTFVISSSSSHVAAPLINLNIGYDPVNDFAHIAMFGGPPYALVSGPKHNFKTLASLIAAAKSTKDGLTYSSPGTGSMGHVLGEFMAMRLSAKLVHVGYKGGAQATTDLLGGHISLTVNSFISIGEHVRSGALTALALAAPERISQFPEVPTFAELGYPDIAASSWFALSGPKNLPADIVHKLNAEVRRILAQPHIRKRLENDATFPPDIDAAAVQKMLAEEIGRWTSISKKVNLRIQ